jgi:PAS domain S-box-containing protein
MRLQGYSKGSSCSGSIAHRGQEVALEAAGVLKGVELQWKKKNGEHIIVSLYARTLRNARGRVIGYEGMVLEITERKQAEAALTASEARYRTIFAASPDFLYLTDSEGKLLDANPALLEWQGLSLEELQQRHFLNFLAGDNREEVVQAFATLQRGQTVRGLTVRARNQRGEKKEFEVNAIPLPEQDGSMIVLSIARDFTDRRRAEAALATLSRQVLEAQEAERRRLAYELHDELGHGLTTLKLMLQVKEKLPPAVARRLQDSLTLVDALVQQVRTLSLDLRPQMLDELGLVATLHWYVQHQAQQMEAVIHFAADALEPRPYPAIETACFRVVQEALTNVVRHAQARHVWVEVHQHEQVLSLRIRDDGVGFDVPATLEHARQGASFGILGMAERLRLIGGHLEIHSTPGDGTVISAHIPLHTKKKTAKRGHRTGGAR